MPHTKFLRAIGDSLQALGVSRFELEKVAAGYVVRTTDPIDPNKLVKPNLSERVWESQTTTRRHAKLFREDGALHYEFNYLDWLDAQGKRKRRRRYTAQASVSKNLGQLLRSLGRHLDRVEPHRFHFSWNDQDVHLDYQLPDGSQIQEVLTLAKLRDLTKRSRYRRAPRK